MRQNGVLSGAVNTLTGEETLLPAALAANSTMETETLAFTASFMAVLYRKRSSHVNTAELKPGTHLPAGRPSKTMRQFRIFSMKSLGTYM